MSDKVAPPAERAASLRILSFRLTFCLGAYLGRVIDTLAIKARFEALSPHLNERARRLLAASEALSAGRGGVAAVSEATGVARSTIGRGLAQLRSDESVTPRRIRRPGGGRKPKVKTEPGLLETLAELVQSAIRGDPEAVLLWVSKSQRHLAAALAERGFTASQKLVGRLLRGLGFSLQANRKTQEGSSHPDRNAQFEHINAQIHAFQAAGQPTISVDTKKKELVGDFKNGGRELRPKGDPEPVRVHDFMLPELAHLPPGTSKWNRIEHRLFAFITQNWRGKPLLTHQVIVQLIASTTTAKGLSVKCRPDENTYDKGIKVSDAQMAKLNIKPADFHGEWNYTIETRTSENQSS